MNGNEIPVPLTAASGNVIGACETRYALYFPPPSTGYYTVSTINPAVDKQGINVQANSPGVLVCRKEFGTLVCKPWYGISAAGNITANVIETVM